MTWVYTAGVDPTTGQPCTLLLQVPTNALPAGALPIQFGTGPTFITPLFCPAAVSPAALAYSYWAEAKDQLPGPQPHTSPPRAVTGKTVYLEIGGSRTWTRTFPGQFGNPDITITATIEGYTVTWGDDSEPTETHSQGGPWPDGDVTHVYTLEGEHDIVVTAHWNGQSNVVGLGPAETKSQPLPVPTDQVQAVVR